MRILGIETSHDDTSTIYFGRWQDFDNENN